MNIIEESKKDIYTYGFECIISNIVYLTIFFAFCLLTKTLFSSLCFWLGIFLLRKIAGGHHANSYLACHFLFAGNHLLFILLQCFLPKTYYRPFIIICLLVAVVSIFICAPVDHKNKPFIKSEYHRYKSYSHIYGTILFVFWCFIVLDIISTNSYFLAYTFGTISATISLLYAKNIRETERNLKDEKRKENL